VAPGTVPALQDSRRSFHATQRAEVLPLIAAGVAIAVAATGVRYLIRAGRRMKEIEEEERAAAAAGGGTTGQASATGSSSTASAAGAAAAAAYGLDFGTTSMRLAVAQGAGKPAEVVENREGSRWTPATVRWPAA
jgi:Hsp70 protein